MKTEKNYNEKLLSSLSVKTEICDSFLLNEEKSVETADKNIEITIIGFDEQVNKDSEVQVAKINATQICTSMFADYMDEDDECGVEIALINIADYMDSLSGDECVVAENLGLFDCGGFANGKYKHLYEEMKGNLLYGNLFYIKDIIVNPEYRGIGIGTEITKNLPNILNRVAGFSPTVVTLCATPIETDREDAKFKDEEKKLFQFYKKCGYKNVGENVFLILG